MRKYYHRHQGKASPTVIPAAIDPRPHHVYTLADPRSGAVRYVGRSINPTLRLRAHIYEAKRWDVAVATKATLAQSVWIRDLLAAGLKPVIRIVATTTATRIQACEREMIAAYCQAGADLINGQSAPFRTPTINATRQAKKEERTKRQSYRSAAVDEWLKQTVHDTAG